jgi:hypothetical protein
MPLNFQHGKIYKLVNNVNEEIYVGSTVTTLTKRKHGHKSRPPPGVKVLYDAIGWNQLQIILVEEWPCENSDQLRRRERHWYDILTPSLNKNRPWSSDAEKVVQKAEHKRLPGSKVKALEYRNQPDNMARALEYRNHPDNMDRMAEYRDKASAMVRCFCGMESARKHIRRHQKSKRHDRSFEELTRAFIFE